MKIPRRDPAELAGHKTAPFIGTREPTGKESAVRALSTREAAKQVNFEILEELRALHATSTKIEARGRSGVVNDVLAVRMVTLDANGTYTMDMRTAIGSIAVFNHNAAGNITAITGVSSGAGAAPTQGTGQQIFRPGVAGSMPIGSHAVTFQGVPGTIFTVHAYTVRIPTFSGVC